MGDRAAEGKGKENPLSPLKDLNPSSSGACGEDCSFLSCHPLCVPVGKGHIIIPTSKRFGVLHIGAELDLCTLYIVRDKFPHPLCIGRKLHTSDLNGNVWKGKREGELLFHAQRNMNFQISFFFSYSGLLSNPGKVGEQEFFPPF